MATRNTRKPAPSATAATAAATETERQQAALAAESAQALNRGLEAMRRINDRAIQGTLSRLAAAAETYQHPHQPLDMLALQGELMRLQMDGAASYWRELSGAALEMQAELVGCTTHLVDTDAVLEGASALRGLPAFPFFPTWGGTQR